MDERVRYAAYGGAVAGAIGILSVPVPYPAASVLMWIFLVSLGGVMLVTISAGEQPASADAPHGPDPVGGPDETGGVPYTRELLFGLLGSMGLSAVVLLVINAT